MLTLILTSSVALAEDSWWTRHQVAISLFPEGLRYAFRVEHRTSLTEKEGILWNDTFAGPGAYFEVTPAYARLGPAFHIVPIAPLDIAGEVVAQGYFGSFSGVTDFPEPDSDYRSEVFDLPETIARRQAGWGVRARLGITPQMKVGRFIMALPQDFYYQWMSRPDGTDDYWYEPQMDALMGWSDFFMQNGAVAFWAIAPSTDDDPRFFWAGVRFDHQYVFGTEDRQLKLGPMFVFKPARAKWVPTTVFFAQAWINSGGKPAVHETFPPYLALALLW